MKYKFEHAPVFTTLTVLLEPGEAVRAESGAMVAMSPSVELSAKSSGAGVMGNLKAAMGGVGLFTTEFTATAAGEVVLAPAVPGDILHLELRDETLLAHGHAYLAGTKGLTLSSQGSVRNLLGGNGLFLSKISGTGDLFLTCAGAVFERALADGESYTIDSGHVVAFEDEMTYQVRKAAAGLFSTLASGEGLVIEFTGPGRVWAQTRNLKALAGALRPYLATS